MANSSRDIAQRSDGPWAAAGRIIAVTQVLRVAIRLASAALLARLLTPADYGIFGMAGAVWGLLNIARDFGIATALQQPDAGAAQVNAMFRLGLLGGIALAAIGGALAVPSGWFFHETHTVPWVLFAMSASFIFAGLAAPPTGLLYREHQAAIVALNDVIAMGGASAAAVVAAWSGAGVWALVLLGVLTDAIGCVLAWRACPWRPGSDTTGVQWRSLLGFTGSVTGHNLANYLARSLDQIAVGRLNGANALGLYGRGVQIAALPAQYGISPFGPYVVATLARLNGNAAEHAAYFRHALNSLLHVAFFAAVFCIGIPDILVAVLFGPQWVSAAPVVRWLGVALAMQPWQMAPLWLLAPRGAGRRLLGWSAIGALLMAPACLLAARAGFTAVAAATAAVAVVQAILAPLFCAGQTPVRLRDWVGPAAVPMVVHGVAIAWLLIVGQALASAAPISRATILGTTLFVHYGAVYLLWPRLRREIRTHVFWSR